MIKQSVFALKKLNKVHLKNIKFKESIIQTILQIPNQKYKETPKQYSRKAKI